MGNLKKIFKNIGDTIGFKGVTSIVVIALIVTLIALAIYFKKRKENFDQIAVVNLKSKLINQFNECFGGQTITLNTTDLQTLSVIDTRTPPPNNISKYLFFNNNTDILTSIKNNISQKMFIYVSGLKTRLISGYCTNVKKNESERNYNAFDNIFKTELKNLYNIILCCIKKYKKIFVFINSINQTYQSISGDLSPEENNDLKNQLHCMLRIMIQLNNPNQDLGRFTEECANIIEKFSTGSACNAVSYNTNSSCYNICGKNIKDDQYLYGMITAPQANSCGVRTTLPTFNPTGANVIVKSASTNDNANSFTGDNTLIVQGLNNLSSTSSGSSPPVSTTPGSTTPVSTTPGSSPPVSTTPGSSPPVSTTPGSTTPGSSTPVSTTPGSSTPVSTTPRVVPISTTPRESEAPVSTTAPGSNNRRRYHHHPMTLPYDIPEMPGPFLPLYSDTYPSNALRDDPYASFHNTDYYISPDNIDNGVNISLENTDGNNNFFMPKIILDEE
jgi:hypothetical protein